MGGNDFPARQDLALEKSAGRADGVDGVGVGGRSGCLGTLKEAIFALVLGRQTGDPGARHSFHQLLRGNEQRCLCSPSSLIR